MGEDHSRGKGQQCKRTGRTDKIRKQALGGGKKGSGGGRGEDRRGIGERESRTQGFGGKPDSPDWVGHQNHQDGSGWTGKQEKGVQKITKTEKAEKVN